MKEPRPTIGQRILTTLRENLLTVLLVSGVVLGCVLGIVIRATTEPMSKRESEYIGYPGVLLIRMLKCAATPLILACIIVALGSLNLTISKTLGWQLVVYVFATKIIASIVGLLMAIIIRPGKAGFVSPEDEGDSELSTTGTLADVFLDMFRNILPGNMMRIYLQQQQTKLISSNWTSDIQAWVVTVQFVDSMNLLGMIFIATVVGLCFTVLQERALGFLVVTREIYLISMKIATWILWTAPVCLFFLIMAEFLHIEDLKTFFSIWGFYILTINVAYLILFVVIHPLIIFAFTRTNLFKFYKDVCPALVTAFVTASSLASLPVLIECLLKHGIDQRVVHFVVPIGVNLNKDGTACFLALATVFVAQMTNVVLSWAHYFTILVLSSLGGMAAAAVPFGSVIVLVMILNGLGLDQQLIGSILAVEWINDRGQTRTNISGNTVHPKILERLNTKLLKENE